MTLALISPSDSYEANAIGFIPPVTRGLVGYFLCGSAAGPLGKNYAPGGADAAVIGAPVLSPRSARFKGLTNYLQTTLPQTQAFSYLLVCKSTDTFATAANAPALLGNYNGPRASAPTITSNGVAMYVNGTTGAPEANVAMNGSVYDGANGASVVINANVVVDDFTAFRMLAFTNDGENRVAYDKTSGRAGTNISGGRVADISSNLIRIGSVYAQFAGLCDIAMCAIYNVGLTAAEIETMYQFKKAFYARNGRGIAI